MKTLDIINLQKKRNELCTIAYRTKTESDYELFKNNRNELRYKIKSAKKKKKLQKDTAVQKFKNNLEDNLQNS